MRAFTAITMTNDLLDLSKIEAGRMDVEATTFDVRELVTSACDTVSPLIQEGVELRQDVADRGDWDEESGGGRGQLVTEAGFTAEQCRRYALSLPISVLACGIQSPENLKQDVDMARTFSPMSEEEMQDMEDRVYDQATDGRHEWFKTTQHFDSQYHRDQHGFPVFD